MANLKIGRRGTGYARGQQMHEMIVRTSFDILVDEGMDALTFGNVAKRMGTKSANVTYYFPTKESLVVELLNGIISNYERQFDTILRNAELDDEGRFKAIAELIILDLATRETTRVFPELWAKSNHDPFVQERLNDLYRRGRQDIVQIVGRLVPQLSTEERELVGVICASCFEGMTIFAGHGKEWESKIGLLAQMTKNILFRGIAALAPPRRNGGDH